MTTGDLFRAVVSRWYVALAGLLLTVLAVWLVQSRGGVYQTRVDVQFLPPPNITRTAVNNPDNDLVAIAGLVEREIERDPHEQQPASDDVPLAGMGVREGTMVMLPNSDGQFGYYFPDPVLRVQAVGESAGSAASSRAATVRTIRAALVRVQDKQHIAPERRVRTRLVPRVPPVIYEPGSPRRAGAVTGLLGLALTLVACVHGDRLLTHRRRSRPAAGSVRATTA